MATINGTFNSLIAGTLSGTVATPGPAGPAGPQGLPGPAGAPGPGLPVGGLEGQIVVKASTTDYDTVWVDNAAETLTATVRNETGATLTKGTVVYINGAAGNKATVTKASASSEAASSKTFAILSADILNNQNGQAVTVGLLKGLNTLAFSPGANLWLSTTAGEITQTPPVSPNHAVFLGNATRIHATQGEIEVRIQNGLELGELHDVLLTSPTNGQVLKYDASSGLWKNGTDVGGVAWGGITGDLINQVDLVTALGLKYDASNPLGFITASALTGYATQSFVTSQGYITAAALTGYATESFVTSQGYITSSALSPYLTTATASATYQTLAGMSSYLTTSAAAASYYPLTGNPSSFLVAADIAGKANLSGATFTGKVIVPASTTASAFVNFPHGAIPSSPTNGDIWTTSAGVWARINGANQLLASTFFVQSQGYTTTTFVVNEVNASKLKPQATFSSTFEVPSSYNNYMLTLDTSEGTNKGVTFGALSVGSNVSFIQGGTDQIVFPSAFAFQNKQASAGPNAVVTAHSTSGGWYLEGDLTYIPAGYVISSSCAFYSGQDALGNTWDGYYYSEAVVADGSGGTYSINTPNANGCWYPAGYAISVSEPYNPQVLYWEVYDSNYNLQASGDFTYSYNYDGEIANGDGTSYYNYGYTYQASYGSYIASGNYYDSMSGQYYYYEVYSDGGSGYYVNQYT